MSRYHHARVLIDITDDDQLSTAANILDYRVVAVALPDAFTDTGLTFYVDPGDGTYREVTDYDGTAVTLTVAANKVVGIGDDTQPPDWIVGANVKVKSGGAEAADRIIWLLCVEL